MENFTFVANFYFLCFLKLVFVYKVKITSGGMNVVTNG